jgi:hypothetical protein
MSVYWHGWLRFRSLILGFRSRSVPSAIVTVHEQFLGSHTYISRTRNAQDLVRGYEFMT